MNSLSTLVTNDLPPPYVKENPAFTLLNPVSVRHTLTVVVNYEMQPTDRFSVRWQGAPGTPAEGSYTSDFVQVGNTRPVELRIPNSLVTYNLGQTITLTYTVISGDSEPNTSQPLILYVLPLAQGDLPRPFIPQADNGGEGLTLDVKALTEFTLRINGWPLIAYDQNFWLRLRGTNANGSPFDVVYWPSTVVDQPFILRGFHAQNHDAAPLNGLRNGSTLIVEMMATLDGSQDEAKALKFAPRNYIVSTNASRPPVILSVKDPLGRDIVDGGETEHGIVTVEGTAMAGGEVEIFDGDISKGTATVAADSGRWTYVLTGLTDGMHELQVKALYGDEAVSNVWTINVMLKDRQLSIKEALDNVNLDPLAATQSLTAVLNYEMEPNDSLTVQWTAAPGTPAAGSHTTTPVLAGTARPREIALPVSLVAFSVGKKAEVTFTYTRGASPPVTSQPFPLNVLAIPSTALIAPVITQANGTDELDLKDVMAGAALRFGGWPHTATGQRIWLDLEGENATGESHNRTVWTGVRNSVHRSWVTTNSHSITIAYSYLQLLAVGSTLSIRFRVNLDQVPDPATAVVFDVREYTVRATP
ncbi:hypothetical protein [Pseudomonas sp. NPDC099000]|uniref:hypothetical protein n=1 Tax=Pseudomonas sp. NPDC099000 TaxID=3364488 RepID=UPI00383A6A88